MSEQPKGDAFESTQISRDTERPAASRENLAQPVPLFLELVEGGPAATRFPLSRTRTLVGRSGCDIDFPEDKLLSRKHAAVEVYNTNYVLVRDLASTNGTFLNGFLVTQARVAEGDVIAVGGVKLKLVAERGG